MACDYMIDFGFQVDDRFMSATTTALDTWIFVCTDAIGVACGHTISPNEVEITSRDYNGYADAKSYLIVY